MPSSAASKQRTQLEKATATLAADVAAAGRQADAAQTSAQAAAEAGRDGLRRVGGRQLGPDAASSG